MPMTNKLILPAESRMQGDLHVRFGGRLWETYHRKVVRRPSPSLHSWEESVKAYKDYVQYKYKGGNYYEFLNRIGYAEDGSYISKVMSLERSLFS